MFRDDRGQGILEYIILIVLVTLLVAAVTRIFRAIRDKGEESADVIEGLDLEYEAE